jgi:methyl-accepting chemotaxis protein
MDGLYWMEEANRSKIDTDLDAANLGYAPDDAARQKLKDDIVASLKSMHDGYARYRETMVGGDGQALYDEVLRKSDAWQAIVHQQIGSQPIPPGVDNTELVRRAIAASEALRDKIVLLIDYRRKQANAAQREAGAEYASMRVVWSLLVLASMTVGTAFAWLFARRLTRQLGGEPDYATQIANRIAAGDLNVRVDTKPGDASSLLFALANMRGQLASIVGKISESSESILLASGEIAQGNTDLSQRTEEQAASQEETASSMEQLTATVRQNADNAQQAGGVARGASEVAARGSGLVGDVVETMRELAAGSKRMTDIIGVIESIAFQKNILALNAAVEAARAASRVGASQSSRAKCVRSRNVAPCPRRRSRN